MSQPGLVRLEGGVFHFHFLGSPASSLSSLVSSLLVCEVGRSFFILLHRGRFQTRHSFSSALEDDFSTGC